MGWDRILAWNRTVLPGFETRTGYTKKAWGWERKTLSQLQLGISPAQGSGMQNTEFMQTTSVNTLAFSITGRVKTAFQYLPERVWR
jgi:hypothetical protein